MKHSFLIVLVVTLRCQLASAEDWPMWRCDSGRSATTTQSAPDSWHLQWSRKLPGLTPAYREPRLQFDAGYEPIVFGKTMFIGSSHDHSLTAYATETGEKKWEFFAEGPIRFAPVAWKDSVLFGSDDGCVYCLNSADGSLRWKFRAAPSKRHVISDGRMISLWPVRGGPVLHDGRVYFAAGVWSFEGVFIYCLDAASGKPIWRNDEASFVYGQHPHNAEAMGGLTPQGYLIVSEDEAGDELIVPCGQAMPAKFDLKTGKLKSFELPAPGRKPGSWFSALDVRRGLVTQDTDVSQDLHEDKVYLGPGSPGVRTKITLGETSLKFDELESKAKLPSVEGKIHTLLAADDKLFVVTLEGRLYCFGASDLEASIKHPKETAELPKLELNDDDAKRIASLLAATKERHGYALIRQQEGLPQLLNHGLKETAFHFVVVVEDENQLSQLQKRYRHQGSRLSLFSTKDAPNFPPYFASLIVAKNETPLTRADLQLLRPHVGVACSSVANGEALLSGTGDAFDSSGFDAEEKDGMFIVRRGELKGAANYLGDWSSPDDLVKAPLGVLWFDDNLGHFKRSPQPKFVDGVMISHPKDWMEKHRTGRKGPYDLLPAVYSDVYTGRRIAADESLLADVEIPLRDMKAAQPSQYRPPTQKDAWRPQQPVIGERVNPLTGERERRVIPKSYGCDGGVDYGYVYTMRSGTPAFYDKRLESGVCSISGPRSGCTNSIIPAGGVLNVPFFYEGCTCSYPLPVGLSLVSMPETHEQWASWGKGAAESIERIGINLGAPGDRMTRDGTLWLDIPSRGGPSPEVVVTIEPKAVQTFYQHSLFVNGGKAWPWVAASGIQGAKTITVTGLKSGTFDVRLTFLDPEHKTAGKRNIQISINGDVVEESLDIAKVAGGQMQSLSKHYQASSVDGAMQFELKASVGDTIVSGIELVRQK